MKNKYVVNNFFNNDGIPFTDLITKILTSFLNDELMLVDNNNIIFSDIVKKIRLEN